VPQARQSRVGAHVAVGSRRALAIADEIAAEVVQIFVGNPRGWASPRIDPAADERFRSGCAERGLPVFVHAPYLINFGSPSPETLTRSSAALAFTLARAATLAASGVVLHAGSAVHGSRQSDALRQVREHLPRVLDEAPGPPLLIEPTAGGGGALAWDAASLAGYLGVLDGDERIGVCLDTCHMHSAGHDLSTKTRFAAALRDYASAAGQSRIGLVHVNDSRDAVGSRRDRHARIGAGTIGVEPFRALMTSPVTRGLPLVVETADEDHAADIATLKRLRGGRTA
jgi:deoxyribonuclease-4